MEQPVKYWVPSIAPSGMAFYDGDRFPRWKGSLFVGALRDQKSSISINDIIVKATTDDGLIGWGESCSGANVESAKAARKSA